MEKKVQAKTKGFIQSFTAPAVVCFCVVLIWTISAHAGTGGTEFSAIYDTLTGWTSGALGKTIAAGAFLTGIAMGVVKQSIIAVVTGISTALAVNYTPTIIDAVVTALI
jgi:conjugal transfer pilus assembly protein TraA